MYPFLVISHTIGLHYYISKRTKNYHSSPSAQNASGIIILALAFMCDYGHHIYVSVNDAIVVVPVSQLCKRFKANSNITNFNGTLNRCKKPPIDSG